MISAAETRRISEYSLCLSLSHTHTHARARALSVSLPLLPIRLCRRAGCSHAVDTALTHLLSFLALLHDHVGPRSIRLFYQRLRKYSAHPSTDFYARKVAHAEEERHAVKNPFPVPVHPAHLLRELVPKHRRQLQHQAAVVHDSPTSVRVIVMLHNLARQGGADQLRGLVTQHGAHLNPTTRYAINM